MKRVVLVTGHYLKSKRKAGFHWLADALWHEGWEVIFMTAPISWLSVLRCDYRLSYPIKTEINRMVRVDERLWSYIWFTKWHPANFRVKLFNQLTMNWVQRFADLPLGQIEPLVNYADVFIFDCTPALLLFKRFKKENPQARYIYRVSDDTRLAKCHPAVIDTEEKILKLFDMVSVPSRYIFNRFKGLPHLKLNPHGIKKDLFDMEQTNPYGQGPNLVYVGVNYFDCDFLNRASRLMPEWKFHIIGPIKGITKKKNIFTYGEVNFTETVPFIKYADIGLQSLQYNTGAESFTESLKVIQYTYSKIPIVAPNFLQNSTSHIFYYTPNDDKSIRSALIKAINFDRSQITTEHIYSWHELAKLLIGEETRLVIKNPINISIKAIEHSSEGPLKCLPANTPVAV
jgi:2-beta-glucuronyltransferase